MDITSSIRFIPVVAFSLLAACSSSAPETLISLDDGASKPVIVNAATMQHLPAKQMENTRLEDAIDVQRLNIGPHKVECESYELTQCWLNQPVDQVSAEYFYEAIEGFDYQWGYHYELLVSVSTEKSMLSDTFEQHYQLLEVISQSAYGVQETFEYVARYGDASIENVAPGQYQLTNQQTVVCEPSVCAGIDSALEQQQALLMTLQYGALPGDPLLLVALDCVESTNVFNSACLSSGESL